ncbi:MAG: hypothetical protein CL608_12060 [Anaerolineaceae bacterium]|nr:hypothetical protein [Anaerolineaceae bacterium]
MSLHPFFSTRAGLFIYWTAMVLFWGNSVSQGFEASSGGELQLLADDILQPGDPTPLTHALSDPADLFIAEPVPRYDELTTLVKAPENLRELMKPVIQLNAEHIADGGDLPLTSSGIRVSLPTYPFWGPPPPMIDVGYQMTWLDSPPALALPDLFHEYRFGASWIRLISDEWKMRVWAGATFNTDGENTSGDALFFRGGLFGIYSTSPEFEWIFGVVALGRSDLPAVPALGLVYRPDDDWSFDFTFPRPQATWIYERMSDRQFALYAGGGLNGTTWAFEEPNGRENQITYSDWRLVMGWESTPLAPPGVRFAPGTRLKIETGFVFARELEFERFRRNVSLANGWTLNGSVSF